MQRYYQLDVIDRDGEDHRYMISGANNAYEVTTSAGAIATNYGHKLEDAVKLEVNEVVGQPHSTIYLPDFIKKRG